MNTETPAPDVGIRLKIVIEKEPDNNRQTLKPAPRKVKEAARRQMQQKKEKKETAPKKDQSEWKKLRNNVTEIMLNTNATPFRSHTDNGYTCCFCINAFLDPADLKQHTILEHVEKKTAKRLPWQGRSDDTIKMDITSLHCNLCGDNITKIEQITEHLHIAHNKKVFTDIKNLMLPFKFDSKMLTCCICSSEFYHFKPLQEHMNTHYRNFICELCNSGYVSSRMLRAHSVTHKTGTFDCGYCPKQFSTMANKKMHEKSVHTKTMVQKCGQCSEQFRYIKDKDKHLMEVHCIFRSEFRCQPCDKTFSSQLGLMRHTKRHHLMERPHQCEYCDMAFFSSKELKYHMPRHTGVRDFKCDICHKSYPRKFTLQQHMRIHEKDRRTFKCEHCQQSFMKKYTWKNHMLSKHGEQDVSTSISVISANLPV